MFGEVSIREQQLQAQRVKRTFVAFDPRIVELLITDSEAKSIKAPRSPAVSQNVSIVPLTRIGKGQFVGGVSDRADLTELSIMRGNAPVVSPLAPSDHGSYSLVNEAWFGGIFFNHFGHFLLEGLARLSSDVICSSLPILFYNPQKLSKIPNYAVGILEGIGVSPERILFVDEPVLVARLHHVAPWFEIRRQVNVHDMVWISGASARPLREYADRAVYLSRSRLEGRREVASEAALEEAVTASGGLVRFPELLSIQEQIAMLRNCKSVAGIEGSALHTCVLTNGPNRRVIICDRPPNLNFLLQDEILGGETVYINRSGRDGRAVASDMMRHLSII